MIFSGHSASELVAAALAFGVRMAGALIISALIGNLSACAVGPNFKRPAAPTAAGYGSAPVQGETVSADDPVGSPQRFVAAMDIPGQWWTLFQSPKLDHVVEQALKANPDVGAAQAALRSAHELYLAQWTSIFPTVQGNFSADRAKNAIGTIANPTSLPQTNPYYNLYTRKKMIELSECIEKLTSEDEADRIYAAEDIG
ncbi:MAG: hypothetical protein ACLPWG_24530, partial [Steroidobacteraceae bacterium]